MIDIFKDDKPVAATLAELPESVKARKVVGQQADLFRPEVNNGPETNSEPYMYIMSSYFQHHNNIVASMMTVK
jgi:hypothetical protein